MHEDLAILGSVATVLAAIWYVRQLYKLWDLSPGSDGRLNEL